MAYIPMYHGESCVGLAEVIDCRPLGSFLGEVHHDRGSSWAVTWAEKVKTGQIKFHVEPATEDDLRRQQLQRSYMEFLAAAQAANPLPSPYAYRGQAESQSLLGALGFGGVFRY